jgi:hypothetical protein
MLAITQLRTTAGSVNRAFEGYDQALGT